MDTSSSPYIDTNEISTSHPQYVWESKPSWPPILGGERLLHAMVVVPTIEGTDFKQNSLPQCVTVIILGGLRRYNASETFQVKDYQITDSVVLMDLSTDPNHVPQWREGPPMMRPHFNCAAVACNGAVYVITKNGGIERINIHDLVKHPKEGETKQPWVPLKRLPGRRGGGHRAVVLKDRFIVVVGENSGNICAPFPIEVLDTGDPFAPVLIPVLAPEQPVPRAHPSVVAVGSKVYIIGGKRLEDGKGENSVECIEFKIDESVSGNPKSETQVGSSNVSQLKVLSWKLEDNLCLSNTLVRPSSVLVGTKIVVAGGFRHETDQSSKIVEVLDLERKTVTLLPNMKYQRFGQFLVAQPGAGRLLAVGGRVPTRPTEILCYGHVMKSQPMKQAAESIDSPSPRGLRSGEKRPPQVNLEDSAGKPCKHQKKDPEVQAALVTPCSVPKGKVSLLERVSRLEAATAGIGSLEDIEKRMQSLEHQVSKQQQDHQKQPGDKKALLDRLDSLEQKFQLVGSKQISKEEFQVTEHMNPSDISNETISQETKSPCVPNMTVHDTLRSTASQAIATESTNSFSSSSNGLSVATQEQIHEKMAMMNPSTNIPNMTLQDRMCRLETTLLGSTLLYSAWILWNHWTR